MPDYLYLATENLGSVDLSRRPHRFEILIERARSGLQNQLAIRTGPQVIFDIPRHRRREFPF
jgi:hypothetical protein